MVRLYVQCVGPRRGQSCAADAAAVGAGARHVAPVVLLRTRRCLEPLAARVARQPAYRTALTTNLRQNRSFDELKFWYDTSAKYTRFLVTSKIFKGCFHRNHEISTVSYWYTSLNLWNGEFSYSMSLLVLATCGVWGKRRNSICRSLCTKD
jgi:hypothetical protein